MLKKHLVYIPMPIATILIIGLIVDQHPIATLDNEPIEQIDLEAPNVTMSTYKSTSMMWVIY